jgi:uncharacterized protein (TIGR02757 family)
MRLSPKTRETILAAYARYHRPDLLELDPLITVRSLPEDERELFGLVAACLSYGRVETIIATLNRLCGIMKNSPRSFITDTGFAEKKHRLSPLVYRFTRGEDIAVLCEALKEIILRYGNLENLYQDELLQVDLPRHGAGAFSRRIHSFAHPLLSSQRQRAFAYLLPRGTTQSPCKRLNMYLRWMIRPDDGIDCGLWKNSSPAHLIIPLDTHILRISRELHLARLRSASWNTAAEITCTLGKLAPKDPVKFDFSLCHWSMTRLRGSDST